MMSSFFIVVVCGIGLLLLCAIVWRVLIRRVSLPCPPSFIWLLENKVMERVAGGAVIIQRARIAEGMRVLDAGCGAGRLTIPIARHVGANGHVVALDVQSAMLARLADRVAKHALTNVTAVHAPLGQGDIASSGQGPIGRDEFDRAIMVTVLGEIPDKIPALREVHDSLKPGGILSVTEVLPDPHYQSKAAVRRMAKEVGFEVEEAYSGLRSFTFNLIRAGGPQQPAGPVSPVTACP